MSRITFYTVEEISRLPFFLHLISLSFSPSFILHSKAENKNTNNQTLWNAASKTIIERSLQKCKQPVTRCEKFLDMMAREGKKISTTNYETYN